MLVPGATISGLMSSVTLAGPRELDEFISSPGVWLRSKSLKLTSTAWPASNSALITSPSSLDMLSVGMSSKLSPRLTPIGPGMLLYTITATAPAALALAIFSTNASSPRCINATLPVKSLPSKSVGLPSAANSSSYFPVKTVSGSADRLHPITSKR
ncbi:hypothetical protein D3C74_366220 [compost metagenome]